MDHRKPTAADYGEEYYMHQCGVNDYVHNPLFIKMFNDIARILASQLHPRLVLDAGCACGHMVSAFRNLGVGAYGIDLSEYAISQVRAEHRQFCAVQSLTAELPREFPRRYDLVLCIEVMEHLTQEDGELAIARLCSYSDLILFSSSPSDTSEPTHINVRPLSHWLRLFHRQGFHADFLSAGRVFNPQCLLLSRRLNPELEIYRAADRYWEAAARTEQLSAEIAQLRARLKS